MSNIRGAIAAVVLVAAASRADAGVVYYLDIVNTSRNSVTAVEVARAGSTHFRRIAAGGAVAPAGSAATIAIRQAEDGCRRDLRFRFDDGHVSEYRGFDLCAGPVARHMHRPAG